MEDSEELERYIDSQAEGQVAAGLGQFTLNSEQAIKKLAGFQLPFEGAWIVKLVQAATRAGCKHGFSVKVGTLQCELSFDASGSWTTQQFCNAFYSPTGGSDLALRALVEGLRFIGVSQSRVFTLQLPNSAEQLTWDGSELVPKNVRPERIFRITVTMPNSSGPLAWLRREAKREAASIAKCLEDRCFAAPFHLRLDGRKLNPLSPPGNRSTKRMELVYCLGGANWMESPPTMTSQSERGVPPYATLSLNYAMDMTSSRHNYDWVPLMSRSRIHWVQDGVVLESQDIALEGVGQCACHLYLSGQELATDLSGLRLVKNQKAMLERRKAGIELGIELLEKQPLQHYHGQSHLPMETQASEPPSIHNFLGLITLGLATPILLPISAPAYGILTLGAALYTGGAVNSSMKRRCLSTPPPINPRWELQLLKSLEDALGAL